MNLAIDTATNTVRDISNAPTDADASYLALTMHLRPVVDGDTLAGVLSEIADVRRRMDATDCPNLRAYCRNELADLHSEARAIRTALRTAADLHED
ncbi:hypothetical protein ACGFZB_28915 [Streptomyces cinerochromogenes]|uniref:Uncharacterized protein n=1 Tax=Streptomyces cinerochromogenes TaxID=66422 RepID=A0ABW7BAY9_9ACTN